MRARWIHEYYPPLNWRPDKINESPKDGVNFTYDAADRLTSKLLPNMITSSFTYDAMSRLESLKHENSSTTLYFDQFSYNSANQISQITGLSATRQFTYDNIDRLTAVTDGTNVESYTYDLVGNRTASHRSSSYTTGSFNRLTATATANYDYDFNGSITGNSLGQSHRWDRENRLIMASAGQEEKRYEYDALGRRVSSLLIPVEILSDLSGPTKFIYDGLDVILDDNSELPGGTTRSITYQNAPGIDNKMEWSDGRPGYFLQDHLGSTVALTDSAGDVSETNSYDSFGNPANESFSTRYQFTGREFESISNLQYSRARWYDPAIGRFISEDPIGLSGGINQYSYVGNNPVNATDPSGLYEIDVHYYLTKYLAENSGCFGKEEARQIAEGNQQSDELPDRLPGLGNVANGSYHALSSGAAPGYGSSHLQWRSNVHRSVYDLGVSLHYLQDTFSHEGYSNSTFGHSPLSWFFDFPYGKWGTHSTDKTASDVEKTLRMAKYTYGALARFGREQCGCDSNPWNQSVEDIVRRFAEVPTRFPNAADTEGNVFGNFSRKELADPQAVEGKRRILGVDRR